MQFPYGVRGRVPAAKEISTYLDFGANEMHPVAVISVLLVPLIFLFPKLALTSHSNSSVCRLGVEYAFDLSIQPNGSQLLSCRTI